MSLRVVFISIVCLTLLYSEEASNIDVTIDIHTPSLGSYYKNENGIQDLKSNISIIFNQGPISTKVRSNLDNFLFCCNWDIWHEESVEYCHRLDEVENIPNYPHFKPASQGYEMHRFRASLKYTTEITRSSIILVSQEVSYFVGSKDLSNTGDDNAANDLFNQTPCEYSGVFPAIVPWSIVHGGGSPKAPLALAGARLDIPLDLKGQGDLSWHQIETLLYPQFLSLCETNSVDGIDAWLESTWTPEECARDLLRQCEEWYHMQCSSKSEITSSASSSLSLFRKKVSAVMDFDHSDWSLNDFKENDFIEDRDKTDGCSSIQSNGIGNDQTVYIIGSLIKDHFVRRQRDFILRDILGCLNKVHICAERNDEVEDHSAKQECDNMLAYANRMNSAHSSSFQWTCGKCDVNELNETKISSILISSFSGLDEMEVDNELHSVPYPRNLDFQLKREWAPQVIIHLNDEVASSSFALHHLYSGAQLTLRMYGQRGTVGVQNDHVSAGLASDRISYIGGCKVVTIPIGYLAGFADDFDSNIPRSGTQAVRDNTPVTSETQMKEDDKYLWSFVGNRCSHHAHVADTRSSMGAWLPLQHDSYDIMCHFSERDGIMSSHDTARIYRSSLFVGSPHGESTDCFRHYEAVISGAVPIIDVSERNNQWSWTAPSFHAKQDLPYPVGWIFPRVGMESEVVSHEMTSDKLLWTRRAKQIGEWPAHMGEGNVWKELAHVISEMSYEEVELRRQLNKQWYISEIQSFRQLVQQALPNNNEKDIRTTNVINTDEGFEEVKDDIHVQFKSISRTEDDSCVSETCYIIEVDNTLELQAAVRKAAKTSTSSSVSVIIVLIGKYYEILETLVVKGKHLKLTFRGRSSSSTSSTSNVSPLWSEVLSSSSTQSCLTSQSVLDGKHEARIISLQSGAALHLDNIAIYRGSCFGEGGGISVSDYGTTLTSGIPDIEILLFRNEAESNAMGNSCVSGGDTCMNSCIGSVSFINNAAGVFGGGGLNVDNKAQVKFYLNSQNQGAYFRNNEANSVGGAINVEDGAYAEMSSPIFNSNSAYRGGAIGVNNLSNIVLNHPIFHHNVGYFDGGGIYVNHCNVTLNGAVFVNNSVSMGGSAIHGINEAFIRLGPYVPSAFHKNCASYGHEIGLRQKASLMLTLAKNITAGGEEMRDMSTKDIGSEIQWGDYVFSGDLKKGPMFTEEQAKHWSVIDANDELVELKIAHIGNIL